MVCKNCNRELPDGAVVCPGCGTFLNDTTNDNDPSMNGSYYQQQPDNMNNGYNQYQYSNPSDAPNVYPSGTPYGYQPYQNQQQNFNCTEKLPKVKDYVLWFIITSSAFFPPVGLILCIVFACSSDNKARADFCRARLIITAAEVVLSILIFIGLMVLGFSVADYATGLTDNLLSVTGMFR